MAQEAQKMYRSKSHKVFLGVCGGIAEYLKLDPIIIRIIFIILAFWNGIGIIAYIVSAIFMPENPYQQESGKSPAKTSENTTLIVGAILVMLGLSLFFHEMFSFFYWRWPFWWFHHIKWQTIYPTIIILIGVAIVIHALKNEKKAEGESVKTVRKRIYRSKSNRLIGGVCGGIAEYLDIDVTLIRIAWVVLTLLTNIFVGTSAYILFLLFVPEEDEKRATGTQKPARRRKSTAKPKSTKKSEGSS